MACLEARRAGDGLAAGHRRGQAYEIKPLHDAGLHGEGMTIAIVSFDKFTPSDVDLFDQQLRHHGAPPVDVVH